MPDSQQPPFWGSGYNDRDLDALLSGGSGSTPPALLPVESTLTALRSAPSPRELSAEAAARAAFRSLARPVTQATLVLPLGERLRPAAGRRQPSRHRRRRRSGAWGGRRTAIALTSVGAAGVVIGVAVSGAIPGSIGQMMSLSSHPASSASSTVTHAGASPGSVLGSGKATSPSPRAVVTGTASTSPRPSASADPATLCREWFSSWKRGQQIHSALFDQLSVLAGGQHKVWKYCLRALGTSWLKGEHPYPGPSLSFGAYPGGLGYPGYPGAGNAGHGNQDGRPSGGATPGGATPDSGNAGSG